MTTETRSNTQLFEMFLDGTPNENTKYNRLQTVRRQNGAVALVAYGASLIAEVNESTERVIIHNGHRPSASPTVRRWLTRIWEESTSDSRYDVVLALSSPKVGREPETTGYIRNYVGDAPFSDVERDAVRDVETKLKNHEGPVALLNDAE